jgi:predicted nucleic acid-binding protein
MIAYIDSSIVVRHLFGEGHHPVRLSEISIGISSELLRLECLRTLDRFRLRGKREEQQYLEASSALNEILSRIHLIEMSRSILHRAGEPFTKPIATLDAIHLATCLIFAENSPTAPTLCSYDKELLTAAQFMGLSVRG